MPKRLTTAAIKAINSDPELFRNICLKLEIKPASMPQTLKRNGNSLNRYDVVELIANHMGIDPSEAVEEFEYEADA